MRHLYCACCGEGFRGVQHHDRDTGYGICRRCGSHYGYHTEGPEVVPVEPNAHARDHGTVKLGTEQNSGGERS